MKVLSLLLLTSAFVSKPPVEKYVGGSPYHSRLILTLFRDSTFTYSTWYHNGPKKFHTYKGIWHKTAGRLVLDSKKKNGLFHNESYTLKGDTLKLYTKEDSVKSYRFYQEYKTLLRQR